MKYLVRWVDVKTGAVGEGIPCDERAAKGHEAILKTFGHKTEIVEVPDKKVKR